MNPMQNVGVARGMGAGSMFAELKRLGQLNRPAMALQRLEAITERAIAQIHAKPPLITRPRNGQPLNILGQIDLPAAGSTSVVISYRVPVGYWGTIQFISTQYAGANFREGSGDLTWSLLFGGSPLASIGGVNQDYPFYQYGRILESIGSLTNPPWAVGDGYEIRENQYILMTVKNATGSLVTPGGKVIGSIVGWTAPL